MFSLYINKVVKEGGSERFIISLTIISYLSKACKKYNKKQI